MKSILKRIHRGISERSGISYSAAQTKRLQCLFHITPIDCGLAQFTKPKLIKNYKDFSQLVRMDFLSFFLGFCPFYLTLAIFLELQYCSHI
jgi:hypothetical protein